jgi:hypothetical protein
VPVVLVTAEERASIVDGASISILRDGWIEIEEDSGNDEPES